MADESRIRKKILEDYRRIKGRPILVRQLTGFVGEDSVDFFLRRPALVRVVETMEGDLSHKGDPDWFDPYWNLELLAPHPELEDARSLWMFGTSYNVRTGEVDPARYWSSREWRPRKKG